MIKRKFKIGQLVKVISLKESERYGLDGGMRTMMESEKLYPVSISDSESTYVNGYYFDPRDLIAEEDMKDPDPVIFHFNAEMLEV